MTPAIAIVGLACCYPDARSPLELWENVLAQRQAFRRLPPERLHLGDYLSANRAAPDHIYVGEAALIEGYEFDRVRFRVAGSTFRTADMSHWLALDVAAQALADAGFPEGESLPQETTGVVLGNTLTGEFARANLMRVRWPYVRRVLEAALGAQGWTPTQRREFLASLEEQYKAPFPPVGEESLAGGLSNTIAGRICNHFDLKGGGYTVDGACASSLLAITTACSALVAGDLDVALAGGVDLSMDPFELIGFAKMGALASENMWVYDTRSAGFWPGEGCGVVVLMRQADAVAQQRRIYAVIRGWGVSSDGSGGLTRPEVSGQLLAVQRAYRRAGFGIDTVTYFEGHGTGTSVGDATELHVFSRARREAAPAVPPAIIGSIKANIGHTKAAAGVAGLIKATLALHHQMLPPTTGCEQPHSELKGAAPALQVLRHGILWPADRPLRAGVSAMGFGGMNSHVVLEGVVTERRQTLYTRQRALLASAQDAELVLLGAQNIESLQQHVMHLLTFAGQLSRAEVTDLAFHLAGRFDAPQVRAAMVVSRPAELVQHLEMLHRWLTDGVATYLDTHTGVYLGSGGCAPRLGFLFPGQGSPTYCDGGAWRRRFPCVQELYARAHLPTDRDNWSTAVVQPALVTASMAALRVLDNVGLTAHIALGHSLGELTALHWAGVFDEAAVLRIATVRGAAMAECRGPTGAMASLGAGPQDIEAFLQGTSVVIAGLNAPSQTVIAGEAMAVDIVVARAQAKGVPAVRLPVSHAFHSPLVATAVPILAQQLEREQCHLLQRLVVSTVTGGPVARDEDVRALLCRQVTAPVRFMDAVTVADAGVDLWLEVGPGQVLTGLLAANRATLVIALDAGGPSLRGLLGAVGAAFALGASVDYMALFTGRFVRPFSLDWCPRFFVNPCELAPRGEPEGRKYERLERCRDGETAGEVVSQRSSVVGSALDIIRELVAARAELPIIAVRDDSRLLGDLHLNSITVGQLVVEAARRLGLPPPVAPTDYANATVAGAAQALEDLARTGGAAPLEEVHHIPSGVDTWIRTFTVDLVERSLSRRQVSSGGGEWQVIAPMGYPLAPSLQQAFGQAGGGGGVVVCLPPEPDTGHISLLLEGARAVMTQMPSAGGMGEGGCFVLVQHGGGAASFARTLHLEALGVTTCVVDVPLEHPQAVAWVLSEARAAYGYTEAHYDLDGTRRVPVLRLLPMPEASTAIPLSPEDVLIVTGGGKGIAAECALALARETGVRLVLLGRSQPDTDPELAANLARMTAAGITYQYFAVDVTDAAAVRAAVHEIEATCGVITAILHGAGTNMPQLLPDLDAAAFRSTLAPKLHGARNLLAVVNPECLRLFVVFGSIIARTGMRGEADYALANEWLTHLTERFQATHPRCRCLVLEWSVWSGVGMGERLGRVDALMREGITPIPPDMGIAILRRLLGQPLPAVSVVVTGRFGDTPTLQIERPDLPFLRFLEQPRVYYPGVELVVDAELSSDTDPYLNDHVFQGERLLPGVMGLEAMAQTVMALTNSPVSPTFEDVQFSRPVVVPDDATVTIRMAALVHASDYIEVVLRSSVTAFQVDHFRARCHFGVPLASGQQSVVSNQPSCSPMPLVAAQEIYREILFHRGRFCRLQSYHWLQATSCVAEVTPHSATDWFGRYLPTTLVLGDPAARDAAMHAIQACIPHGTLLPTGVERLLLNAPKAAEPLLICARERRREGDLFIYDIDVKGEDGVVRERWEGLRLQKVSDRTPQGAWLVALLGPYLERRISELLPGVAVSVAVMQRTVEQTVPSLQVGQGDIVQTGEDNATLNRHVWTEQAIRQALGTRLPLHRRSDGKLEIIGKCRVEVSVAHTGYLTLIVAGLGPIGCDLELVVSRSFALWRDLLGPERFELAELLAKEACEDQDIAATRVWAATECLKKAGVMLNAPLLLTCSTPEGWSILASGPLYIATIKASVQDIAEPVVLAVLSQATGADMPSPWR